MRLLVQPPALAAEQPAGDRLSGQRMAEPEHVGLDLPDQPARHQHAHGLDQVVLADARHDGKQIERDSATEHGGGVDNASLGVFEAVKVAKDRLAHARRQRPVTQAVDVDTRRRADQLLEEERVAGRSPGQTEPPYTARNHSATCASLSGRSSRYSTSR